jgi:hypothetical protein
MTSFFDCGVFVRVVVLYLIGTLVLDLGLIAGDKLVFSNLKYVPESGDRVGTVVCLRDAAQGLTGVFADVEGGDAIRASISGSRSENSITFSGKNPFGALSFRGVLQGGQLRGTLTRQIGTGPSREELLRLPLVKASAQTQNACEIEPGKK